MLIGGYEDSMKRLGVQSWQAAGAGAAPSYHFDMLQDSERNEAYRCGIEATVEEDDLVVDIGTGSGLLALMAALAGAQHVFAIEGDPSLERAARKVIEANGKAETVTVVGRHSTQVKVGFGSDVPTGADVIVTEIFDSWLLGEGMVPVMHDAVERSLLAPHGRVVPAGAQIWAVLVESDWLACHQQLPAEALAGCVRIIAEQGGAQERRWSPPEPVQVHANMLEARCLGRRLSEPFAAQAFDFARPLLYENRTVDVKITCDGRVDAVMLWWTADMDGSSGVGRAAPHEILRTVIPDKGSENGAVRLSTRPCDMTQFPVGTQTDTDTQKYPPPEREHWRQAACVLPASVEVIRGQTLWLHCAHTGTNDGGCAPRFALAHPSEVAGGPLGISEPPEREPPLEGASAISTAFPALRRCHILQLGNAARERKFFDAAERIVARLGVGGGVIVTVGDGPLVVLAAGRAVVEAGLQGKIEVLSLQSSIEASVLAGQVVAAADLQAVIKVRPIVAKGDSFDGCAREALLVAAKEELGGRQISAVMAEPLYYALAVAGAGGTWLLDEALRFHSEVQALQQEGLLTENCQVLPHSATLWCRPLQSSELWRRRKAQLANTQGIDLSEFNAFRPRQKEKRAQNVEEMEPPAVFDMLPWEGSIEWLSDRSKLLDLHFAPTFSTTPAISSRHTNSNSNLPEACIDFEGTWHGVAVWMSLSLSPSGSEGEGGGEEIVVDACAGEAAGYSQALYLLATPQDIETTDRIRALLKWLPRDRQAREMEGAEGVRAAVVAAVAFEKILD